MSMDLYCLVLLLNILCTVITKQSETETEPDPGVRSLNSSLQVNNRNFACPGEIVTYSCFVYGDQLDWDVEDQSLGTFKMNDSAGAGFVKDDLIDYCYIFSGVLEGIYNLTGGLYPDCYSIMSVISGNVMNGTLISDMSCNSSNSQEPFNISCSVSANNTLLPPLSLVYKMSGIPNTPSVMSCVYYQSKCSVEVTLNVRDNATDLDYYLVDIFTANQAIHLATNVVKVSDYTVDNVTSTFYGVTSPPSGIQVNVTVFDKCAQQVQGPASECSIVDVSPTFSPFKCEYFSCDNKVKVTYMESTSSGYNTNPIVYTAEVNNETKCIIPGNSVEFNGVSTADNTDVALTVSAIYPCGTQAIIYNVTSCNATAAGIEGFLHTSWTWSFLYLTAVTYVN